MKPCNNPPVLQCEIVKKIVKKVSHPNSFFNPTVFKSNRFFNMFSENQIYIQTTFKKIRFPLNRVSNKTGFSTYKCQCFIQVGSPIKPVFQSKQVLKKTGIPIQTGSPNNLGFCKNRFSNKTGVLNYKVRLRNQFLPK